MEIPLRTITVDGDASDWAGLSPLVEDPAGDENPQYAAVPWTDLRSVHMARDDTHLYFLMTVHDFGRSPPNPELQTAYFVEFQQYLNQLHTPGDLRAVVGAASSSLHVDDRGPGGTVASYPSDHLAVGEALLEWKVPIAGMQFPPATPSPYFAPSLPPPGIENQFIRAYIHPGPHPNPPPVSDENDGLTRPMIINFYPRE